MSEIAIQVQGLSKQYFLGSEQSKFRKTLRESLTDAITAPFRQRDLKDNRSSFWALRDVSFTINRGEVVGIIGRNGAGKSTLLKILSRITEPTEGEIEINGRVGSLLEVGTGFHHELTGRENVYLNGAILGMKRADITRKFDEIVAFAGTEKFLDTPVKFYSSGMYMRLAFAVAAHLEPEILIVDEVLAVGDAEFQKKCIGKMSEVARQGRTVMFVSHNLAAIQNLCTRGVLLAQGQVVTRGAIAEVVDRYRELTEGEHSTSLADRKERGGNQRARIEKIELLDQSGDPLVAVVPGVPFRLRLTGVVTEPIAWLEASVDLDGIDGTRITTLCSGFQGVGFSFQSQQFQLECEVEGLNLRPDIYILNTWLGNATETFDFVSHAASVEVSVTDFFGGGKVPERAHGALMSHFRWTNASEAVARI